MAKYQLKTKETDENVYKFINTLDDEQQRKDCDKIIDIMKKTTKYEPKMWGKNMIGFGSYHYKYTSGHEGEYFITGFSPRKNNLTIYIISGLNRYPDLMNQLGKYKTSKSCLYIKKLEDVNIKVLQQLIKESFKDVKNNLLYTK